MGTPSGIIAQQQISGEAKRVAGTLVLGFVEENDLYEHNELSPSVVAYITNAIAEVVAETYAGSRSGMTGNLAGKASGFAAYANTGGQGTKVDASRTRKDLTCLCFMLDPENNSIPKESNGYLMGLQTIRTSAAQVTNEVFSRARLAAKNEVRLGEFTNDEFALELRRRQINDYIHKFGHTSAR